MLNTYLYGQSTAPLAVHLEAHQRTIDQNKFPDYRGVFDKDKRTLWKFGGGSASDYKSNGLFHWAKPELVIPHDGEVHQRHVDARGGQEIHRVHFRPYDLEKN